MMSGVLQVKMIDSYFAFNTLLRSLWLECAMSAALALLFVNYRQQSDSWSLQLSETRGNVWDNDNS